MIGRLPGEDQPGPEGLDDVALRTRAWEAVLTSLEHDVQAAEAMLSGPYDPTPAAAADWQPPQLDGPVPDHLVARAHDLLRRHAAVQPGLARALAQSRADLDQLRPGAGGGAVLSPAYVDISA